jgi:hypothetical protein
MPRAKTADTSKPRITGRLDLFSILFSKLVLKNGYLFTVIAHGSQQRPQLLRPLQRSTPTHVMMESEQANMWKGWVLEERRRRRKKGGGGRRDQHNF